ncbi:MAG: hypothetical protein IPM06_21170 [Rhizobiales bacterium]|nr:hypothetical protein [Hyphomicrobiales bacterium]
MSLPRKITIDTHDRRHEGAYVLVTEWSGQAPIIMETEGCDSSVASCRERAGKLTREQQRWCIARLVPVEGNELLILDLERLQQFNKKDTEE